MYLRTPESWQRRGPCRPAGRRDQRPSHLAKPLVLALRFLDVSRMDRPTCDREQERRALVPASAVSSAVRPCVGGGSKAGILCLLWDLQPDRSQQSGRYPSPSRRSFIARARARRLLGRCLIGPRPLPTKHLRAFPNFHLLPFAPYKMYLHVYDSCLHRIPR
jgi:hypothetical protein